MTLNLKEELNAMQENLLHVARIKRWKPNSKLYRAKQQALQSRLVAMYVGTWWSANQSFRRKSTTPRTSSNNYFEVTRRWNAYR